MNFIDAYKKRNRSIEEQVVFTVEIVLRSGDIVSRIKDLEDALDIIRQYGSAEIRDCKVLEYGNPARLRAQCV
jgi:hypothetical protein